MAASASRPPTTHETVLEELRAQIIGGTLAPGSRHSIYQLAERFGVSRTPVREAVLQLASAGMIVVERNRGIRIRGLAVADVREIFDLRLLLEVPAAAFAAHHGDEGLAARLFEALGRMRAAIADDDLEGFAAVDRELHAEILGATRNERLCRTIEGLRDATTAMGASTMNRTRGLQQIESEHVPIVQAIAARDAEGAAAAMRIHLLETGRLLQDQVASMTDEPVTGTWLTTDGQHRVTGQGPV